jgi:hypothetical protein
MAETLASRGTRHYEAAVEDYLRANKTPYVTLDESRRVKFSGVKIKSFDFLIYPSSGPKLIADVKGRKFPYDTRSGRRYWENWVSRGDLDGLQEWERAFGDAYRGVLVFAYLLSGESLRWPQVSIHVIDGARYAFLCAPIADYARHARERSSRWDTVSVPGKAFRQMVLPLADLL